MQCSRRHLGLRLTLCQLHQSATRTLLRAVRPSLLNQCIERFDQRWIGLQSLCARGIQADLLNTFREVSLHCSLDGFVGGVARVLGVQQKA